MSDWWYLITMVGVAAGMFALSRRNGRGGNFQDAGVNTRRNMAREQEDNRLAQMSEDDRVWELDSLHQHRETQAPDSVAPEP